MLMNNMTEKTQTIYELVLECVSDEKDADSITIVLLNFKIILKVPKLKQNKEKIMQWLDHYPEPDRLKGGVSYIELGAIVGDQRMAIVLMVIGEYFNWWTLIHGEKMGMSRVEAIEMAGRGFIMTTGYTPK